MLTFQMNSIEESSSSLYCTTTPTTIKMHCVDQQSSSTTLIHDSNQNGGGDNSSSPSILATMMTIIPDSNNTTTSSTYPSYYNNETETPNNNNTMNTSKTSTISNEQQHFNSDNHYTIIKSSTTLSLSSSSATSSSASTPSPSYDDNNTVVTNNNQEKTLTLLDNSNVNVDNPSFTMLGGSSQDTLLPPLLLPENIHNHNQYYPQIQLNITVPTGSVTTGTGSGTGTIQQQQTFPIIYDPEQISKINYGSSSSSSSYLEIIEQPTNRIRYRYRSEKGSHGGLNGANSSQIKKTYPTIKIVNYHHSNPVYIRASLATNDDNNPPRSHVHKLMGRHCNDDGSCTLAISENMTAVFQNLGILFIGKKEVPEILFKRKLMELRSSNYLINESCTDKLRERLREEAEKEAKDFNLNSVRLCFEAFMLHNNALYPICPMVYSRPIANQKSPDSGELKIVRINRFYGSVTGGDEIYLLCEKVNKKEIRVRFFENTDTTYTTTDGSQAWEAFGDFNESDVHHQVAIVFRTPPYKNQQITKPIQVYIQLYRQRDGEYSEPKTFIYKPKTIFNQQNNNDNEDLVSNNGVQECALTRTRMENQSLGFKKRKYADSAGRINCYPNNNKSTNGKSCSTSSSITSSSPTSSSSSSSCSSLSSNNNNISYDNIIIKKELDNEINLISYATPTTTIPTMQQNYTEQQDLCTSMDVSLLNQIPKHPNHSQNVNNNIDMKKSNESCCSIRKYTNTNTNTNTNLQYCSSSPSPSSTNNGTSSPCISPSNNHHGLSSNLRNGNIVPLTTTLMPEPHQHPNDFNHLDSIWTPPMEQQSILLDYPNCCSHADNPNNVFRSSNNNTSADNGCIQTSSVDMVTNFPMMDATSNNNDNHLIDNQLCSSLTVTPISSSSYNHLQYNNYNSSGDVSTLYSL